MGLSKELENSLLDHVFNGVTYTPPKTIYVGIFDKTAEVSAAEYARQEITFTSPSASVIENDTEIRFPIAQSEWGSIESGGLFDAKTGGTRLDDDTTNKTVRVIRDTDQFVIPKGNFTVEFTTPAK